MKLAEFFGVKKVDIQRQAEKRLTQIKNKEDKRIFERQNMKPYPDKLPDYTGKEPIANEIDRLTIRLVFHSTEDVDKFKRWFRVSNFKGPNITDLGLIMALLENLENGNLLYDYKTKTLTYKTDRIRRRNRSRGTKVDVREQTIIRRNKKSV